MGRWWKGSLFVMAWTTGRIAGEAIARRLRQAAVALAANQSGAGKTTMPELIVDSSARVEQ